jgi:hypothetical protein
VRGLGRQLRDVVEVDVVFGARGGSHYELQTLVLLRGVFYSGEGWSWRRSITYARVMYKCRLVPAKGT